MELVRYTDDRFAEWENFISTSINGNFLHSRKFYDHNAANAADDCSLLFFYKNKLLALLPAILYKGHNGLTLHSHLRSTYGGYISSEEAGLVKAVEIVKTTINFAKAEGVKEIIIRNPFRILYNCISDETDYAMWYNGFNIKARELETYIDLTPDPDIIKSRYSNGTRYNILKAWKTVTVEENEDFSAFWKILSQNLNDKHGREPVHSLDQIQKLRHNVGKENIKLFGCFFNNVLIGGCVVFVFKYFLHAQYIAQDYLYQEHRPINAVIDYIIDWGKERGFRGFNLGSVNEDEGKYINTGLSHFKESFGGRGVLRETMNILL